VDAAVFTYLNALPLRVPLLGRLVVPVAAYAIVLYALLLLWLWVRAGATGEGRRVLLLAVFAAVLSLGANAVLNVVAPRPRPFLVLPAHVLVPLPHVLVLIVWHFLALRWTPGDWELHKLEGSGTYTAPLRPGLEVDVARLWQ